MIQWNEVIDMFPVTYEVTWFDGNGDNGSASTNQSSYTINGLTYDNSYNVAVIAINTCCGAGPASNIIIATNTTLALVTVEATSTVTLLPIGECKSCCISYPLLSYYAEHLTTTTIATTPTG